MVEVCRTDGYEEMTGKIAKRLQRMMKFWHG